MVKNAYGRNWPLAEMLVGMPESWRDEITRLYMLCEWCGVSVYQVKVKYGGLRFYVGEAPQVVHDAIDLAEKICYDERLVY